MEQPSPTPSFAQSVLEELRVLIVAGVAYGAVVAGLGGRLAMFLLRITSPNSVRGVVSDDGFVIGRFTLGGTYALVVLGAFVGVIGVGAYRLVRRWLIGPPWFRQLTTGAAAGVVAGSMLVHSDGVDFRLLEPTWFAIGLFVALPAVFGAFIGPVVDRVASAASWTRKGRRRWLLPIVSVVFVPPIVLFVAIAAGAITVLHAVGQFDPVRRLRDSFAYGLVVRGVWMAIAVLGAIALVGDVQDISRLA